MKWFGKPGLKKIELDNAGLLQKTRYRTAIMNYALITGASSGIGRNISMELAKKGYSILAVSNQQAALEELKIELEREYRVKVISLALDLAEQNAANQIFDFCRKNELEVEILVNNAGILLAGEAIKLDIEKVSELLMLHVHTSVTLSLLFGNKMKSMGKGFIMNVSSISAVMPYPIISLYGPSKTFIRHFTRAFRKELKAFNVKVSCLIPGATDTAIYAPYNTNTSRYLNLGLMGKPEKVAKSAVHSMLAGKAECIPGFLNKLIVFIFPLIPGFVISWAYYIYKKKRK